MRGRVRRLAGRAGHQTTDLALASGDALTGKSGVHLAVAVHAVVVGVDPHDRIGQLLVADGTCRTQLRLAL